MESFSFVCSLLANMKRQKLARLQNLAADLHYQLVPQP